MVSFADFSASVGMNWIALAPFPITTTFLPRRSQSWFQRAEWNEVPSKLARPGRSGTNGRFSWPGAAHQHVGHDLLAALRAQPPLAGRLVEARGRDLAAEADVRDDPVLLRGAVQVLADLGLARELVRPLRVGLERVAVEVRRDVAGRARVRVVVPGSADPRRLLEDRERVDPGLLELDPHAEAGDACAEDRDAELGSGSDRRLPRHRYSTGPARRFGTGKCARSCRTSHSAGIGLAEEETHARSRAHRRRCARRLPGGGAEAHRRRSPRCGSARSRSRSSPARRRGRSTGPSSRRSPAASQARRSRSPTSGRELSVDQVFRTDLLALATGGASLAARLHARAACSAGPRPTGCSTRARSRSSSRGRCRRTACARRSSAATCTRSRSPPRATTRGARTSSCRAGRATRCGAGAGGSSCR